MLRAHSLNMAPWIWLTPCAEGLLLPLCRMPNTHLWNVCNSNPIFSLPVPFLPFFVLLSFALWLYLLVLLFFQQGFKNRLKSSVHMGGTCSRVSFSKRHWLEKLFLLTAKVVEILPSLYFLLLLSGSFAWRKKLFSPLSEKELLLVLWGWTWRKGRGFFSSMKPSLNPLVFVWHLPSLCSA